MLIVLIVTLAGPASAATNVDVSVHIGLPPPIVFPAPPALIVIPETYVYVVPDTGVDIFFYNGWWWRPWEGRWYRSRHYNTGWVYYRRAPAFYRSVPPGWRDEYRHHRWQGHPWNYRPIPHDQVQRNWRGWERNRHWEKQQTWGVQGLQPRPRTQPSREVQMRHEQQPRPQAVEPRREPRRESTPPQRAVGQPQRERGEGQPVRQGRQQRPQHQDDRDRGQGEGHRR